MEKIIIWRHVRTAFLLLLLQLAVDYLYIYLYPTVNPLRATLIGATALLILYIPFLRRFVYLEPGIAVIPLYLSALFGAFLVQAGVLASKSLLSGAMHALILIGTYVLIVVINPIFRGRKRK